MKNCPVSRRNADHGGAEHVVVGQTTFAPGEGAHELHAHPSGDEFQIILQGQAAHVMPDGTELPLGPGDMTLMPAGELHGEEGCNARESRIDGFRVVVAVDTRRTLWLALHPVVTDDRRRNRPGGASSQSGR